MTAFAQTVAPPSKLLALLEPGRALWEYGMLLPACPLLAKLPQGDGHPVMVFPGFLAGDSSTAILRAAIRHWGYRPYTWGAGRNLGLREGDDTLEQGLARRLEEVHRLHGEKVTLIGWSLGGVFARELARRLPDRVRGIITLGSPLGDPRATNVWRMYESVTGTRVDDDTLRERLHQVSQPVPDVPSTAVFSKSDCIVSWRIAREQPSPLTENIQVSASHLGLGHNPAVLYVIANRLYQFSQPAWSPFDSSGLRKLFYA